MGYPQPNSNAPAIAAQNSFRLLTPLFGGDMYESEQGAQAFAIGPNSDVDQVAISYYDDTNKPTMLSQCVITPQRPNYGLTYARMEPGAKYQPSGRQGRILIAPLNIWNPFQAFGAPGDTTNIVPPNLDVIQYFTQPPTIPVRSDRLFNIQNITLPTSGTYYLGLPCYGRVFMSTALQSTGDDITYGISGVNFTMNDGTPQLQFLPILAPALVSSAAVVNTPIKSSTWGKLDYLVFSLATTTPNEQFWSLKVVMSDQAQ